MDLGRPQFCDESTLGERTVRLLSAGRKSRLSVAPSLSKSSASLSASRASASVSAESGGPEGAALARLLEAERRRMEGELAAWDAHFAAAARPRPLLRPEPELLRQRAAEDAAAQQSLSHARDDLAAATDHLASGLRQGSLHTLHLYQEKRQAESELRVALLQWTGRPQSDTQVFRNLFR